MKRLLTIIFCLVLLTSCAGTDNKSNPQFEIVDIDLSTATYPDYVRNPDEFTLHNDEYRLSIYIHVYNEVPIASETILIVNESNNETYMEKTLVYEPPLEALSDFDSQRWSLGYHIFTIQGAWPSGLYTLHVWVTDINGNDSTYTTVDLNIIGKSILTRYTYDSQETINIYVPQIPLLNTGGIDCCDSHIDSYLK